MVFGIGQGKDQDRSHLLLSSDSLEGYGLDMIFEVAKEAGFEGIDLAMWQGFDAWNVRYVKKLVDQYEMPVRSIQTSRKVNAKELNKAVDIANEIDCNVININAPKIFNVKSYKFIKNNLKSYKKHNRDIDFCIVNPPNSGIFMIPLVKKYHFPNLTEIIKKYKAKLSLDIVYVDEGKLENKFLKKVDKFIPNMGLIYLSDKNKSGEGHLPLGDGNMKLNKILRVLRENDYKGDFSLKLDLDKKDLSDIDKIILMLKKSIDFYKEYYLELDE